MSRAFLLPWMDLDVDRRLLTIETSSGSRRFPITEVGFGLHCTLWQIWMENGAGFDVYVDHCTPPWSGSKAHPVEDGWLSCTLWLIVRKRDILHEVDGDMHIEHVPASIRNGTIIPRRWDNRTGDFWWECDVEDPDEFAMYVDKWGSLPVQGLDRGFTSAGAP